MGGGFWSGVGNVLGKVWNLPNTSIGLVWGGTGVIVGAGGTLLAGATKILTIGRVGAFAWYGGGISFGNNAIQFTNNPMQKAFGGGVTLGNTIAYAGLPTDAAPTSIPFLAVATGLHELQHTFQGQVLGPLYLPANIIGGVTATLGTPFTGPGPGGSPWHGPLNFMERGPMAMPPRPWP